MNLYNFLKQKKEVVNTLVMGGFISAHIIRDVEIYEYFLDNNDAYNNSRSQFYTDAGIKFRVSEKTIKRAVDKMMSDVNVNV